MHHDQRIQQQRQSRVVIRLATAMAILMTLCSGEGAYGEQVVIDDDMSSPSYTSSYLNSSESLTNPDDISSALFVVMTSGGNPGGFLEVSHFHDVLRDDGPGEPPLNGDGLTDLQSYLDEQSVTYNPSIDGGIGAISFSIDVQTTDSAITDVFFTVRDGSIGYAAGFTNFNPDGNWNTVTVPGLTSADFGGVDFLGNTNLQLGFGFLSNADVSGGSELFTVNADNFKVSVTPVPEPGFGGVIGVGCLALCLRRRRSRKQTD